MSAPTVDITNMDRAKLKPGDKTDAFQDKAILSSQNMFNIAEKALKISFLIFSLLVFEPLSHDLKHVLVCHFEFDSLISLEYPHY